MIHALRLLAAATLTALLAACASKPETPPAPGPSPSLPLDISAPAADSPPQGPAITRARSRWVPVRWADLPGFEEDDLADAWNAFVRSCERPGPTFGALCSEVRRLTLGSADQQRQWLRARLQPYRVEPLSGYSDGLLTSYFEPLFQASRLPRPGYTVPLYRPPPGLSARRPWFTRQQMDQHPEARAALQGQAIAWLADPVDALILQIQGSGRVQMLEADGSQRLVRLAFAATNEHPYRSPGKWLIDQGLLRGGDATWPGIRATLAQHPQHLQQFLWSNPRMVFFREEAMSAVDAQAGPRGAQGVPLTPGRSIAVDPQSIPYGTPVWLSTPGPTASLNRLVLAQDTGNAIVGAVRADYFAGWGAEAGDFAGRIKQPLRLWVLWPR